MKTQHWIETALDCEYIDQKASAQLVENVWKSDVCWGMMHKAEMFCGTPTRTLREEAAEYLTITDN